MKKIFSAHGAEWEMDVEPDGSIGFCGIFTLVNPTDFTLWLYGLRPVSGNSVGRTIETAITYEAAEEWNR